MGWHYESLLITPEQLPSLLIATAAGNSEAASTVNAVCEWFTSMRSRKRGNGFLCLTCDDEFLASKPPRAIVVMTPMFPDQQHPPTVVSGVCRRCYEVKCMPDFEQYLVEAARMISPDATIESTRRHQ